MSIKLVLFFIFIFFVQSAYSITLVNEIKKTSINITGNVIDNSCEVVPKNIDVNLFNNPLKQLSYKGAVTANVLFSINLIHCGDSVKAIKVVYKGEEDNIDKNLLAINKVPGSTEGVAIQLLNSDKNQKPINQLMNNTQWIPLHPGSNVINYYARLKATTNKVTYGHVRSQAIFNIEYL
ncbi:fimbrial protein [Photobacterium leiognathi]|uniref:fimbrial protein n=1 Tax=Photobacterium leiognathi TaxID=553611 RepID=UPI0029812EB3|nr:fimbrial protein [Photobacterium leiognathi]